jgi:hypothetical protein
MLKVITHISFKSEAKDAYSVILSSESHPVACNSDGEILSGELAKAVTTVHVFKGSTELLCGTDWIIDDIVAGSGASFSATSSDPVVALSSLTANSSYVDITVSIEAEALTITKRFAVTKQKAGNDSFQLVTSQDSIPVRCSSNGTPSSLPIAIQVRLYKGGAIYNLLNWYSCSVSADSSSTVNNTYSSDSKLESEYFTINLTGVNANTGQITISIVPYAGAAMITKTLRILKVIDGPAGSSGAIYLPRGEWNATDTYTKTAAVIMYVVYLGYCYEPNVATVTGGNTPLYDVQHSIGNWKSMGKYDVVATQVLLANFALLAGGVFWNNKLMSQYGKDSAGNASTNYSDYSEDGSGNENGNFHPNILLDWITGFTKLAGGNFKANSDGSVEFTGSMSTATTGKRIVLDPEDNSLKMYDSLNRLVLSLEFNEWNDGYLDWSTSKLLLNAYMGTTTTPTYYVLVSSKGIEAWQGSTLKFRLNIMNGAPLLMFDTATFPTAGGYVGQVYRNGSTLCIKTS